jgi:pimeloyl-ACP methyl ester carboxylesterase
MRLLSRSVVTNVLGASQPPLAIANTRRFMPRGSDVQRPHEKLHRVQCQSLTIDQALNCNTRLSVSEKGINALISLGSCGIVFLMIRKPTKEMLSVPFMVCMGILCTAISYFVYAIQIYQRYSRLKRSEEELKSHNSTWIGMQQENGGNVNLHCRVEVPSQKNVSYAIHCVHGFGSHSFSYSFVQKRLADALSSLVTSHDMCGFGLSQRPRGYIPYTMKFHGLASVHILDKLLEENLQMHKDGQKVKKILIGHSLGCSAVAEAIIEGQDIAGAIMIAPAILSYPKLAKKEDDVPHGNAMVAAVDSLIENEDSVFDLDWDQIGTGFKKVLLSIKAIVLAIVADIATGILFMLSPILKILLGVAVFPRRFWDLGLASAVKTKKSIRDWDIYLDNYRTPVLVRGWEEGLLRFVLARISRKKGILHVLRQIWHSKDTMPQAHRLADINNIPILIVHGKQDMIVPVVNSKRLAEYIPNTKLKVMEHCGHMPHEEFPSEFLQLAQEFIKQL